MGRALKIISRCGNPGLRRSEVSASGAVSTEISRLGAKKQMIGEIDSDLNARFGRPQRQRKARREQTPKERIALKTINKLMLTVSHYLSNPLTVLLGRVELLSEATENGGMPKEDMEKFVESCKREIHKIDLIIKVFQNLCEVRYKTYPPGIKMLDVEDEIKNRLNEVESCPGNSQGRKEGEGIPLKNSL
ncbi:MAG: histidine kinase dimerization/phospho-acceptor domain-containing protein [Candidatus Zixiibacteriota bacterium]